MIYDYLVSLNWPFFEQTVLVAVVLIIIFLARGSVSAIQKILKIGVCFFIITIFIDVIGLPQISDHFSLFGFIIISVSLLCLFWNDTYKQNET